MKPREIPQNKTIHGIFKKESPSITVKKKGPEAIASPASPNIHHWLRTIKIKFNCSLCYFLLNKAQCSKNKKSYSTIQPSTKFDSRSNLALNPLK